MSDEGRVELSRPAIAERDSANTIGQNVTDAGPAQRPSSRELKRILAKHRGWIAEHQREEIPESDH
jgi:hypothetical protein